MISYLPVSHIVAQIADIWMIPSIGGTIHFADNDALKGSLLKTLTKVRPTRYHKMSLKTLIYDQSFFSDLLLFPECLRRCTSS